MTEGKGEREKRERKSESESKQDKWRKGRIDEKESQYGRK